MGKTSFQIHNEIETEPLYAVLPTDDNPGITAVLLSGDRIGDPAEHGEDLLRIFLNGLCDRATMPDLILIYGSGVLLMDDLHPAFPALSRLTSLDIVIKACEESLAEYKKEPAVSKIQPVPMSEITQDILKADRIIRP